MKPVSKKELELLSHKDCVRFALFCAEQVKDGWKDRKQYAAAIEISNRWLEDRATREECLDAISMIGSYGLPPTNHALKAASNAVDTTYYAAVNLVVTASICAVAASDASNNHAMVHNIIGLIDAQWNYYHELLHFDDIAEKLLLGESV